MRTSDTADGMLFNLSYDEEYDLAMACMDMLSDMKTSYDDEQILNNLMEMKIGKGITINEKLMVDLLCIGDRYVENFDDVIIQNDDSIYTQYGLNQLPIPDRTKELRSIIKMAWREAWKNHSLIKTNHPNWKDLPIEEVIEDDMSESDKEKLRAYRDKEIRRLKNENPDWEDYEIDLYIKDYVPSV